MKRIVSIVLALVLVFSLAAPAFAASTSVRGVTWKKAERTQGKKASFVHLEYLTVKNSAITKEFKKIVDDFDNEYSPLLETDTAKKPDKNSRLDVDSSFTVLGGGDWAGFLFTAQSQFMEKVTACAFQTRNYNLSTGKAVTLSDVFADDKAFQMLSDAAYEQLSAYFGDEQPDEEKLRELTSKENIANASFILGAVELTLCFDAKDIYKDKIGIMFVHTYYPDFAGMLSEEAVKQIDLSGHKLVAITYDDGPSSVLRTSTVAENLRKYGARATFFQIGIYMEKHEAMVSLMHNTNQSLQIHGYEHLHASSMTKEELSATIDKFQALAVSITGERARLIRAPYGDYGHYIRYQIGYPLIQWKIDTNDWNNEKTNKSVQYLATQRSESGDIVLLHDSGKKAYKIANGMYAELLRQDAYCLTVEELLKVGGAEILPDTAYFEVRDALK